jgi:hypothetical protein
MFLLEKQVQENCYFYCYMYEFKTNHKKSTETVMIMVYFHSDYETCCESKEEQ